MRSSVELVCVADFLGDGLNIPAWRICGGQAWCIFGRNGSGKQLLDRLLVGELATESGLMTEGSQLPTSRSFHLRVSRRSTSTSVDWRPLIC